MLHAQTHTYQFVISMKYKTNNKELTGRLALHYIHPKGTGDV